MKNKEKTCEKCGSTNRYRGGECRSCSIGRATAWAKKNPARVLFISNRTAARKGRYTPMSLEECQRAVVAKPESCESCHDRPATSCDHDHKTGIFRGWLCKGCNTSEGSLGTLERAKALVKYIQGRCGSQQ